MNTFLERNARRLLIAGGLAFFMGAPTIACMGGGEAEVGEDAGGDEEKKEEKKEEAKPESKIIGSWQMRPPQSEMRNFKIIDAAVSGKPQKKQKLGQLKGDEKKLFDEVAGMKGPTEQHIRCRVVVGRLGAHSKLRTRRATNLASHFPKGLRKDPFKEFC